MNFYDPAKGITAMIDNRLEAFMTALRENERDFIKRLLQKPSVPQMIRVKSMNDIALPTTQKAQSLRINELRLPLALKDINTEDGTNDTWSNAHPSPTAQDAIEHEEEKEGPYHKSFNPPPDNTKIIDHYVDDSTYTPASVTRPVREKADSVMKKLDTVLGQMEEESGKDANKDVQETTANETVEIEEMEVAMICPLIVAVYQANQTINHGIPARLLPQTLLQVRKPGRKRTRLAAT